MKYRNRREFMVGTARIGAAGVLATQLPPMRPEPAAAAPASPVFFTASEWAILQAAVARIIPAESAGDWSAVDAGAHCYIDKLLSAFDDAGQPVEPDIYAGGPTRAQFPSFQELSRVKLLGWGQEVARLRQAYRDGLAEANLRAGGFFVQAPPDTQELILLSLDFEKHPFFDALYNHVMEGVYGHPVYGGNTNYIAWDAFDYQGDVHGVRFPDQLNPGASAGAWNVHGGYAPEEMVQPGPEPGIVR